MSSVKSRAALAGGRYLVTHPRGRIARWTFRFALRRLTRKLAAASHVTAIPRSRAFKLVVVGWLAMVLGGLAVTGGLVSLVLRRRKRKAVRRAVADTPAYAPAPPTAAPPSPAPAGDDEIIVARVEARFQELAPGGDVRVEARSGVVTLHGKVEDEAAESRVVNDAEQVAGVKAVQSELQTAGAEPDTPSS